MIIKIVPTYYIFLIFLYRYKSYLYVEFCITFPSYLTDPKLFFNREKAYENTFSNFTYIKKCI